VSKFHHGLLAGLSDRPAVESRAGALDESLSSLCLCGDVFVITSPAALRSSSPLAGALPAVAARML
jgi:hypothetical protein